MEEIAREVWQLPGLEGASQRDVAQARPLENWLEIYATLLPSLGKACQVYVALAIHEESLPEICGSSQAWGEPDGER